MKQTRVHHCLIPSRGLQLIDTHDLRFAAAYQRSVVIVDLLVADEREGSQVWKLLGEPVSI